MPLLESVALAIGPVVAKFVIKSFIDEGLISDVSGVVIDLLKDKGQKSASERRQAKQLEVIGKEVAERMQTIFRNISIDQDARTIVVQEFASTLLQTQITAEQLVRLNLDPQRLYRLLQENRPDATKQMSQTESDYYERMLREASKAIIGIATDIEDFERQYVRRMLLSQDQLLDKIVRLIQRPDVEAKEFEGRYCTLVQKELDRLETFGLPRMDTVTRRQSLSVAYITLGASQQAEVTLQTLQMSLFDQDVELHKKISDEHKRSSSASPIDSILAQSRRIVVRGQAGSGKSTLLQWIAVRSALRDFPDGLVNLNNTVPFFIRLREHVKTGFPATEDFPAQVARMISGDMPPAWVHDQLDSGRAIVLVDGVDELPQSVRVEMLESLRQLVSVYPYARYIITSRPTAIKSDLWPEWQEWVNEEHFTETTLQPMTMSQVDAFIDHWYEALNKALTDELEKQQLKDYPRDLKRLLRQRPPLRRVATTPIICAMICALFRERQQNLPAERIELYEACVEMLLTRRDEGRKIDRVTDYPNLSYTQMLMLTQNFAYWLLQNDYSDVEITEADQHFEDRIAYLNLDTNGTAVRRLLVERSGILREPVDGRIDFAHRTFQEYLAAQAAIKGNDIGILLKNSRDDLWRETVILAAGVARPNERERLLLGLLKKADRLKTMQNRYQLYMLAIACLETAVELAPAVRDQVLAKAKEIIPPWDREEVQLLASAGDPIVPFLTHNAQYAPSHRGRCIDTLALIGSDKAFSAVSTYREDQDVVLNLARAWEKFDVNQFASEILEGVTNLSLNDTRAISSLEYPSVKLRNLKELELYGEQVSDIGVLSQLTNLTTLILRDIQVSDLSVLSQLTNLTTLALYDIVGSDLNVLSQLTNLTILRLYDTAGSDLSVLSQLTNLRELILYNVAGSDLSVLGPLTNLTILVFNSVAGSDLSVLGRLTNLTTLLLHNVAGSDLSVLGQLTNLTTLRINNVAGSDLSVLGQLTNLTELILFNAAGSDLNVLGQLTNLTELMLINPEGSDLSVLGQLTNLRTLRLYDVAGSDLNGLGQLTNLTELVLVDVVGSDLSVLGQLTNLTILRLYRVAGSDLSVLGQLTNLTELVLNNIGGSDLSVLGQLTNLTELMLNNIGGSDLSVLGQLTNLRELSLMNTPIHNLDIRHTLSPSVEVRIWDLR